jgi:hypothetical protein
MLLESNFSTTWKEWASMSILQNQPNFFAINVAIYIGNSVATMDIATDQLAHINKNTNYHLTKMIKGDH